MAQHQPFGGVVPELASRAHVEAMPMVLAEAMEKAGVRWDELDAVAVTRGPGLASSLLIGASAARALAIALDKPLLAINHLDGHLHSLFLDSAAPPPAEACPMLVLLVSGGHTLLVRMERPGESTILARTLDDAAGEALDKGAKLMGLGYPGGPAIEQAAAGGDADAIKFPRGIAAGVGDIPAFSFSGLKTSLLYYMRKHPDAASPENLKNLAASYQESVFCALMDRVERALDLRSFKTLGCVGGVAKNRRLRGMLVEAARSSGVDLRLAPMAYCTDNAAMIAAAAGLLHPTPVRAGDLDVDPNWPLPVVL